MWLKQEAPVYLPQSPTDYTFPKGTNYVFITELPGAYRSFWPLQIKTMFIEDKSKWDMYLGKRVFTGGALLFWKRKGFSDQPSSQDKKPVLSVTDQLEVGNSNGTLLIHVLLVFVLYQTLHQVPRVYLVICHILEKEGHIYTSFIIINKCILYPIPWKM